MVAGLPWWKRRRRLKKRLELLDQLSNLGWKLNCV
jgi:hypothetical protein